MSRCGTPATAPAGGGRSQVAQASLYYCQGHQLATFGEPLFQEAISAWDMGPVVGTLWHDEKHHGIDGEVTPLSEAELNTIGYVVSRYGRFTGTDLVTGQQLPGAGSQDWPS
jgi:uncharacterized phage-associated protein